VFHARELVEVFHLHFLRQLTAGRGKDAYVVKGGCNLRFFFGSIRYSEYLDLDVAGPSVADLRERVDGILRSRVLRETLEGLGVELVRASAPKQTETTQRWKMRLQPRGAVPPLSTKVEFSRRPAGEEGVLEVVDKGLIRRYGLMPLLLSHYDLAAAVRQKVGALVGRREVQARDVFDLSVLFSRAGERPVEISLGAEVLDRAVDRVLELGPEEYLGQVVAYLDPDRAESMASREMWEALQLQVIDALGRARREAM
jgi:predicted nucleotidyltransferase component of viral defense system